MVPSRIFPKYTICTLACAYFVCQLNAYHSERQNIMHLSKHLNSAPLGRVSPDKRQRGKGGQREEYFSQREVDNPLSELERQFFTCFNSILGFRALPTMHCQRIVQKYRQRDQDPFLLAEKLYHLVRAT